MVAIMITTTILIVAALILGGRWYLRSQFGRCRSKRKLDGYTAVVTGANTGIGKEVARELAKRGAKVILGCRNLDKGDAAKRDIIESTGNTNVHLFFLDLSSFDSVRKFADEVNKSEDHLHILVNNAGVGGIRRGKKTKDGIDVVYQVNHYGPFLLTNLLIDLLKKSVPSRIVFVSSVLHKLAKVNFDNLDEESYGLNNYAVSKLFNILTANTLAEKLNVTGVTCNCVHPGVVATDVWRNIPCKWIKTLIVNLLHIFQKSPADGAEPVLDVAISEHLEGITGKYFVDCKEAETSELAKNSKYAAILWRHSEKLVKQKFNLYRHLN